MTERASKRSAIRIAAIHATPSTPRPRSRRPVGETAVSYPNADRAVWAFPRSFLASRASELAVAARLLLRTSASMTPAMAEAGVSGRDSCFGRMQQASAARPYGRLVLVRSGRPTSPVRMPASPRERKPGERGSRHVRRWGCAVRL
jgi:hypothetical protein